MNTQYVVIASVAVVAAAGAHFLNTSFESDSGAAPVELVTNEAPFAEIAKSDEVRLESHVTDGAWTVFLFSADW